MFPKQVGWQKTIALFVFLHLCFFQAKAQPGYNVLPDTIVTKKGNAETITIKNQSGVTIEIIRLKDGLRNGVHEVFSPQGKLIIKDHFLNGHPHGDFVRYEYNGKLSEKKKYLFDKDSGNYYLHGPYEQYNNGLLAERGNYYYGKLQGKFQQYHPSGILKTKAEYDNGLLTGEKTEYHHSGKIQFIIHYAIREVNGKKVSLKNGLYQSFNSNGSVANYQNFIDDKKDGKCLEYYPTGRLKKSAVYKEDKLHGPSLDYLENGTLERSMTYYETIQIGDSTYRNIYDGEKLQYFRSGMLQSREVYDMGKKTGTWERYYEGSGLLTEKKSFENNLQTGPYLYYDHLGNKSTESTYIILKTDSGDFSMKHGPEKAWNKGALTMETTHVYNKEEGIRTTYHPNGKIAGTMQFKNGLLQGPTIEYYENGTIKSSRTYKSYYDYSNSPKYNSIGWQKQYDEAGNITSKYYYDTAGQVTQSLLYENNRITRLSIDKHFEINYSPSHKISSVIFRNRYHQESFGLYYYQNGRIRRINFQNPDLSDNSIIDISYDGKYFRTTSARHEGSEKLKPGDAICNYVRSMIGEELAPSPLFTDTVLNGEYILKYTNGKPLCIIHFKDDFPDGSFLVFDPWKGDTMIYRNFNEGLVNGYYIEKFAGKYPVCKGQTPDSTGIGWEELFQVNGLPSSRKTYNKIPGQTIENYDYFDTGILKSVSNYAKKTYVHYDYDGKITSQNVIVNDTVTRYTDFHPGTIKLKTERYYIRDKMDSTITTYHLNGRKSSVLRYKNNKRNGLYETFDENGDTTYSATFINDKLEGWVKVKKNGKVEFLYYENDKLNVQTPSVACGCIDTSYASNRIKFAPSLSSLLDYSDLTNRKSLWVQFSDSLNYKSIFYTGFQQSSGLNNNGFASLNLMLFKEFALNIPADEQIKISLNPCRTNGYISRLNTTVQYGENPVNTDITFHPKRISLTLLKGPVKSSNSDHPGFTCFYNPISIDYRYNTGIYITPDMNPDYCFTPGIIRDFLQVKIDEGTPALIQHDEFQIGGLLQEKNIIRGNELEKFYGINAIAGTIQFNYKVKSNNFVIKGTTTATLLGGLFAAGNIHISCKSIDKTNFTIGNNTINSDDLVNLFTKYGFSRVSTEYDPTKMQLTVYYFAE
ncbi:MAG: hypothetical protein KBB64_01840 [Bacteroidia bacterium]|nr:hypothetical protein [Bacteroidia bacterium]